MSDRKRSGISRVFAANTPDGPRHLLDHELAAIQERHARDTWALAVSYAATGDLGDLLLAMCLAERSADLSFHSMPPSPCTPESKS